MSSSTLSIEVTGVHKTFRIPTHRVETFKERVTHPFRSVEYKELRALDDVSCDVRIGEFVGIAGRNGSGKTTLLKLLASIYRPDSGLIRMAGRVAPFIELGVGFNPDLAARDNIMLNGVMMGLTSREARHRTDSVIEFAELEDFVELKLKNYSSGMRVRLGFAVLVEADADILLIDEVLAVGDASFQQKCTDVFYDFQKQGRTIVLVTHAMEKLKEYCDRAILLHEGKVDRIGDPDEVGNRYLELNFKAEPQDDGGDGAARGATDGRWPVRVADFRFEDGDGARVESIESGEPLRFAATIELKQPLPSCCFGIVIIGPRDIPVLALRSQDLVDPGGDLEPGRPFEVRGTIQNVLASGHYFVHIGVTARRDSEEPLYMESNAGDFLIWGAENPAGMATIVAPSHEFHFDREPTAVDNSAERLASR